MTDEADVIASHALKFIREYTDEHGYPPTRREVGEAIGRAKSTVQDIIVRLRDRGLIRVQPYGSRTAVITEAGAKALTEELA